MQNDLRQFFNDLMVRTGGATAPGFPIVGCKLYPDKNYAFMEFRTVEEASNCMALDGVAYGDSHLRVGCLLKLVLCSTHSLAYSSLEKGILLPSMHLAARR